MTIAVGFFDGVHLGHCRILEGADLALTFTSHPLSLLNPARAPRLMMSAAERLKALRARGGLRVVASDFNERFANQTPEEFLTFLQNLAGDSPLSIRCGANWRFGRGGVGDAAWLRERGIKVAVAPYAVYAGEPISSTRIRAALEAGRIEAANAMLGRTYCVTGDSFQGKGEGRNLGYPTINVRPLPGLVNLPLGVYVAEVNGQRAVANYGYAPTFGSRSWPNAVWEFHILPSASAAPQLEVSSSTFHLLSYLRPERLFASVAELQAQIAQDCAAAEGFL